MTDSHTPKTCLTCKHLHDASELQLRDATHLPYHCGEHAMRVSQAMAGVDRSQFMPRSGFSLVSTRTRVTVHCLGDEFVEDYTRALLELAEGDDDE